MLTICLSARGKLRRTGRQEVSKLIPAGGGDVVSVIRSTVNVYPLSPLRADSRSQQLVRGHDPHVFVSHHRCHVLVLPGYVAPPSCFYLHAATSRPC